MKKRSKNIKLLLLPLFIIFTFCGCMNRDYSSIEGYTEVNNAKTLYAELESGHFYMQNNTTGQITEEFAFMYNSNGNLIYSHTASSDDDVFYEYYNGAELSYKYKADGDWSLITYGDDDFTSYTRENKHPYTDGGVISVNASAITDSLVEDEAGGKKITFKYNPGPLSDSLASIGQLKSFESTFWLNAEGYCYRMDQVGIFDNKGEQIMDYSLFIDNMNSIEEITKPEV